MDNDFLSDSSLPPVDEFFNDEPCNEVDEQGDHHDTDIVDISASPEGASQGDEPLAQENSISDAVKTKIPNWRVLWSLIMTNGSKRLTKSSYQSVRNVIEAFSQCQVVPFGAQACARRTEDSLPHYSTLHKTYKPKVLNCLAVRRSDTQERVDLTKAGARTKSKNSSGDAQTTVRTILPSEYARADVASPDVWPQLLSTSLSARKDSSLYSPDCVDTWPVVAAREWYYGPNRTISVDCSTSANPYCDFAEVGDVVDLCLLQSLPLVESVRRCFGTLQANSGSCDKLRGIVCHAWNVLHVKRSNDRMFKEQYTYTPSSRDRDISNVLTFQKYTSPVDTVTVEVPEISAEYELDPAERMTEQTEERGEDDIQR